MKEGKKFIVGQESGEVLILVLVVAGMLAFTMSTLSIYSVNQANYLNRVREAYQMMTITESLAKSVSHSKELANNAITQTYAMAETAMPGGDPTAITRAQVDSLIASDPNGAFAAAGWADSDDVVCANQGAGNELLLNWASGEAGAAVCGANTSYCVDRPDSGEEICAASLDIKKPNHYQFEIQPMLQETPLEQFGSMVASAFDFGKGPATYKSRTLNQFDGSGLKMMASYFQEKVDDLALFGNVAVASQSSSVRQVRLPPPVLDVDDPRRPGIRVTIASLLGDTYPSSLSIANLNANVGLNISDRRNVFDNLNLEDKAKMAKYIKDSIKAISSMQVGDTIDNNDVKDLYSVLLVIAGTNIGGEILGTHDGSPDGVDSNGISNRNLWRYRALVGDYLNNTSSSAALDNLIDKKKHSSWGITQGDWGSTMVQVIQNNAGKYANDYLMAASGVSIGSFQNPGGPAKTANFDEGINHIDMRLNGAGLLKSCLEMNRCLTVEAKTSTSMGGAAADGPVFLQNIFVQ